MFDLIAIGDPVIDTHVQISDENNDLVSLIGSEKLCFDYGDKIPIIDSFQSLGGNAPNVGIAAAKLGMKTALLSTVGNDVNGVFALNELARHKVDLNMVYVDKKSKTRYAIVLNYHSERTILSYSHEKHYKWPKKFPGAKWIYYTGLSKGFETIQHNLIAHLKHHGAETKLAINPGSYIMKYAKEKLMEMMPLTDLLIVNKEEAELVAGTTMEQAGGALKLIELVHGTGPREVVLTDGVRGAWGSGHGHMWHMSSFPIHVIAKTGAGDAFSAAYIAARFIGLSVDVALAWGTADSTGVISEHGPHKGLLDRKGVKKTLERFKNVRPQKLA
jgi:sugar/nucleoside kinase (ribokinase family)